MSELEQAFEPNPRKDFIIESGNLLLADPWYVGYPKKIMDMILHLRQPRRRLTFLQRGVIYYLSEDCFLNVYKEGGQIYIVGNGARVEEEPALVIPIDLCTLIVGDAKTYSLDEAQFSVEPRLFSPYETERYSPEHLRELSESSKRYRLESFQRGNSQTLAVDPGTYTCQRISERHLVINQIT